MEINKVYKVAILLNGREIAFEGGFENEEYKQGHIWKNPMNISIIPTQGGKGQIALNPTCTFGNNESIKPANENTIVAIYDLDTRLNPAYEEVVQQLSAKKSGIEIIPAGTVPNVKDVSKHPAVRNMKRHKR